MLALLEAHAADLCGDAPQDAVRHLFEMVRDRAAAPGDPPEAASRLQLAALHALTTLMIKLEMPQRDAVSACPGARSGQACGKCRWMVVCGLRSCVIAVYARRNRPTCAGRSMLPIHTGSEGGINTVNIAHPSSFQTLSAKNCPCATLA